jgi:hypothetical protein
MISLSNDSNNSFFQCFIRKILYLQKKCNFQSESQSAFEPKKVFEILFLFYFINISFTKLAKNNLNLLIITAEKLESSKFVFQKM